ncbi:MAG: Na(+)-translocating NADH-quinone reductase subunit A [Flavobacteriaceae bacterium]|nr:Na(+)-translocating NADH-quinone reductase subunit A [Flavobacteriaceae bacterium]
MSKDIKFKKGLKLKLKGAATTQLKDAPRSSTYALIPDNFHATVPKLLLKDGAKVQAGEAIFYSKLDKDVQFVSPVSGTIKEVRRGAKRKILEIVIEADVQDSYKNFDVKPLDTAGRDDVKATLLESGCWPFIIQRPYSIVAESDKTPKAIFISAYASAPLAADLDFIIAQKRAAFETGLKALTKLTDGKVVLGVAKNSPLKSINIEGVEVVSVSGPYPAGNVGMLIHKLNPVNAGERVWTVGAEDVAIIGNVFSQGKFIAERTVAFCGQASPEDKRVYYKSIIGASVASITDINSPDVRLISGDVFTGDKVAQGEHLNFYKNELTAIPEGKNYRMFGWIPFTHNNIPSVAGTSLSRFFTGKKHEVNTNLNGEERALVVTGEMESVMPMDVFPMQLLKACLTGDIEKMENLGIYEVAPEDFAVIDYVNTSKIEAQVIIRAGLDTMLTEVG